MADVTRVRDRGQLILITAISMAVMLVTLALLLNNAIYTENLAQRGSDITGVSESDRFREATRAGVTHSIVVVNNDTNASHADLHRNLTRILDTWANTTGKLTSVHGVGTQLSLRSTINGTLITQKNTTRNFTNASGGPTNWTLVNDVERTRGFRMHISRNSLAITPSSGFTLQINNGTSQWNMTVTQNGVDSITVQINRSSGTTTCTRTTEKAWINVTAGTFNHTACSALDFTTEIDPPYNIGYNHSTNIKGTYELIVDNDTLANPPNDNYKTPINGSPAVSPVIYSATIRVVYRTAQLYHNSTVQAIPSEVG